jgi:N-dimethylarginine dimethylaminohydrolase
VSLFCQSSIRNQQSEILFFDVHALPERYISFNLLRCLLRFRVVPGGPGVPLPVDLDVVVTRGTFPGTHRVLVARLEVFVVDRIGGEILIAFDFDGLLALSENCAFPGCFCHDARLDSYQEPSVPEIRFTKKNMPETMVTARFNGHSMVDMLERVLVCSPRTAGWSRPERVARWRELGFLHEPNAEHAQAQHEALCHELASAGAEIIDLPPSNEFSLDAVYTHDASLSTDFGLLVMRPGKANRLAEGPYHAEFCSRLMTPTLAEITAPGTTEAGDIVWLDSKTLLVGRGSRTNTEGIRQMRDVLAPKGIEVLSAPLPYSAGPSACLHLMSLISLLNEKTALVDLPWLAVETVELLRARGYRFIEIDYSERETLACNVLSLGGNRLLAIEENQKTNDRLRQAGFDVRTFPGSELCINGGGGPTCLTRPLLRQ